MKKLVVIFRLLFPCFFGVFCASLMGCHTGTLVFDGKKLVLIEHLKVGDVLPSLARDGKLAVSVIQARRLAAKRLSVLEIVFCGGEKVFVGPRQKFFLNQRNRWTEAKNLVVGDFVSRINGFPCEVVAIRKLPGLHKVYHIDIGESHTFFISRLCIMTHNMEFASAEFCSFVATSFMTTTGGSTISGFLACLASLPVAPAMICAAGLCATGAAVYFCCASKQRAESVAMQPGEVMHIADSVGEDILPIAQREILKQYALDEARHAEYHAQVYNHRNKPLNINEKLTKALQENAKYYRKCECPCHHPRRSSRDGECNDSQCAERHQKKLYAANDAHPNNGARDGFKSPGINNKLGQMLLDRAVQVDVENKLYLTIYDGIVYFFRITRLCSVTQRRWYHGYVVDNWKAQWYKFDQGDRNRIREAGICDSRGKLLPEKECINKHNIDGQYPVKRYCCACKVKVK